MDIKKDIIRRGGDADHDKTFCIFAVRVNSDNTTGQRKLRAGEPYYLMRGFVVDGDMVRVDRMTVLSMKDSVFNQSYKNQSTRAHINFSAIVGMNGSGKSTLVEYMLRLINNFSASLFGEYKMNAATDRLHYLDGIDGELYYYSHGYPYCLAVKNDHVTLKRFKYDKKASNTRSDVFSGTNFCVYDNRRSGQSKKGHIAFEDFGEDDIKYFFYTLVSNHSIYAYNPNDYKNECGSDEEERSFELYYYDSHHLDKPKDIDSKTYSYEEKCWLHGLFHKNDGYQIPLVLNPFRKDGSIDINKENMLARERLVGLMVSPNSKFRKINDHLEVTSITLNRSAILYNREYTNKKLEAGIEDEEDYKSIRKIIFKCWLAVLGNGNYLGKGKSYYEDTIDYVCYKTLKISKQYRQYQVYYDDFKKKGWKLTQKDVQRLIDHLILDSSHITGKLFQALDYLIFNIYCDNKIGIPIELTEIKKDIRDVTTGSKFPQNFHSAYKVCCIPSPIFDVKINVRDTATGKDVDFETLSSGEKQLTFAVSSLLYHLNNIDSVSEDNNRRRIIYKGVNIILEEVELYFHPELQKRLVKYIIDGIGQLDFFSIQGINIILVTHSPFVLSDIPASNILALDENGLPCEGIRSFGSNIHDMLKDSFFLMTGWIGDFVKDYIHSLIRDLEKENLTIDERLKLHRGIMRIDEPVMRTLLLDKYREKYPNNSISQRIEELQKELVELQKEEGHVETE
jgi:energy-coupling factor transporter ATP-binding protein EcfA2